MLDEAIKVSISLHGINNPLKRMILQNKAEIATAERFGVSAVKIARAKRLVIPLSVLETVLLPYIKMGSLLLILIARKQARIRS